MQNTVFLQFLSTMLLLILFIMLIRFKEIEGVGAVNDVLIPLK